ncbi:hypothetical protein D3C73_1165690 [compost metagenome]
MVSLPMASRIRLGSASREEQAERVATVIPSSSSLRAMTSPFTAGYEKCTICGAPSLLLFTVNSGTPERNSSSLLRSGAICKFKASRRSPLIRTALAEATIAATFSVPARTPFSCDPPVSRGNSSTPSLTYSIPTPRGPRTLCGDRLYRSACHNLIEVSSLP